VFSIPAGKSKTVRIKKDLPVGASVNIFYKLDSPDDHGGPIMIVQPEEDNVS
jgi:hypothetical protein